MLAGLLFPVLFFAWIVLVGISGDESLTDGVIRGGVVTTAVIAGLAILIVAYRWSIDVGDLQRTERSRRSIAGVLSALGALGIVGAGAGVLLSVVGHGPVNLAPPTITGTPHVGETLTASPGRWNSRRKDKLEFEYFWLRCRGQDCVELSIDRKRYRLAPEDVGARISVSVLALGDLNTMADSKPTRVIHR